MNANDMKINNYNHGRQWHAAATTYWYSKESTEDNEKKGRQRRTYGIKRKVLWLHTKLSQQFNIHILSFWCVQGPAAVAPVFSQESRPLA